MATEYFLDTIHPAFADRSEGRGRARRGGAYQAEQGWAAKSMIVRSQGRIKTQKELIPENSSLEKEEGMGKKQQRTNRTTPHGNMSKIRISLPPSQEHNTLFSAQHSNQSKWRMLCASSSVFSFTGLACAWKRLVVRRTRTEGKVLGMSVVILTSPQGQPDIRAIPAHASSCSCDAAISLQNSQDAKVRRKSKRINIIFCLQFRDSSQ